MPKVQLWRSLCCPGGDLAGDRSTNAPPSPSAGLKALFPHPQRLEGEIFTVFCDYITLRKPILKDVSGPACLQAAIPQMQSHAWLENLPRASCCPLLALCVPLTVCRITHCNKNNKATKEKGKQTPYSAAISAKQGKGEQGMNGQGGGQGHGSPDPAGWARIVLRRPCLSQGAASCM